MPPALEYAHVLVLLDRIHVDYQLARTVLASNSWASLGDYLHT